MTGDYVTAGLSDPVATLANEWLVAIRKRAQEGRPLLPNDANEAFQEIERSHRCQRYPMIQQILDREFWSAVTR